jgi:hypothetical protein
MEIDNRPAWLSRAMNRNTPSKGGATVQTRSEYVDDLGGEVLFPTLRMGKDGELRKSDIKESLKKKDYILIKGPPGKETADKATAKSKQISKQIGIARRMKIGGALMKTEPAGLGVSPMTQKTSPPVGNKQVQTKKLGRAAAPKVTDPRDEALKLVSQRLKQDKEKGIATPMSIIDTEMPTPMTTALATPPAMPMDEKPTAMKAGGTKSKKNGKGLAVVIDVSGPPQPKYEEASKGTPADPPPGATSDEVKDDQHVLLSEGELVVPANVVRYHGLGMYENLRREALQGLGEMEAAGQVDYVDDDVKSAQAGMTILDAPNVATPQGIARQQQAYNPALGQFGTATLPQAASARFVKASGFTDTNRDGIDDKLQPSLRGLVAPTTTTGVVSPASLTLGPVTNPNVVVGAGNVGSYRQEQTYKPGEEDTSRPPEVEPGPPVAPTKVVQQQSDDGGDPEIAAGLGGARATIGGQEYALQYDFSGNLTGIANVADALSTGRANFQSPTNQVVDLVASLNQGQKGMMSPYSIATGMAGKAKELAEEANRGLAQITNPTQVSVAATKDEEAAKADIMAAGTPRVDAPTVDKSKQATDAVLEQLAGREPTQYDMFGTVVSPSVRDTAGRPTSLAGPLRDRIEEAQLGAETSRRGITQDIPSEMQKARDEAFREEAAAKSRKEAREAQMKGIGLGLSAEASAPGTVTNEALQGKGYSSSGAAPAGSQYSATGIFSTSRTDDDPPSDLGGGRGAGRTGAGTEGVEFTGGTQTADEVTVDEREEDEKGNRSQDFSRTFADDAASSDTGGGKIVCTEMYRQTQLDDWAQAMKTWYIYQKKYLTPIHEIGYHSLFKPFVRGMKVNNTLTSIGAYFAKERTKHLRHILTKGKAKDSIVGNIFCKIIHPIVYLVGLAVHKK